MDKPVKILIIEDNPDTLKNLAKCLEKRGFTLIEDALTVGVASALIDLPMLSMDRVVDDYFAGAPYVSAGKYLHPLKSRLEDILLLARYALIQFKARQKLITWLVAEKDNQKVVIVRFSREAIGRLWCGLLAHLFWFVPPHIENMSFRHTKLSYGTLKKQRKLWRPLFASAGYLSCNNTAKSMAA